MRGFATGVGANADIGAAGADIAGARVASIDGLFITGGLQGEALGADAEGNVEPARLEALCAATGEVPAAALPALRW